MDSSSNTTATPHYETRLGSAISPSLLVVEDDLSLVQWLENVAEVVKPQVDCHHASNTTEAFKLIQERAAAGRSPPFQLVLTDIFLEGDQTGLSLWTECTKLFPDMPVIVTSSLPVEEYLSILCGFNERPNYLKKPLTTATIQKVIEDYL